MNQVVQEISQGLQQIKALHAKGAYDEALEQTKQLLARFPGCAALWIRAGKLLQLSRVDTSPLEEIGYCFENARALSPMDAEADIELGYYLYAVRNRTAEGEECFAEAADKARTLLHDALIGQFKCATERGDRDTCLAVLKQAEAVFPKDREFEALRGELLPPRSC